VPGLTPNCLAIADTGPPRSRQSLTDSFLECGGDWGTPKAFTLAPGPREALARLGSQSCIIDGEAVACGDNGVASFDHIRYRRHDSDVFLYAFDLIELNGDDMRRNR
jgi:hypothetical protein